MDKLNNTALLLALVCQMYCKDRQARVLKTLAASEDYRTVPFGLHAVQSTLETCGIPALGITLPGNGIPPALQEAANDGQAVLLELTEEYPDPQIRWGLLGSDTGGLSPVYTMSTGSKLRYHLRPLDNYLTGRFVACVTKATISAGAAYQAAWDR